MVIKRILHTFFIITLIASFNPYKVSAKNNEDKDIQTLIHLLDYISNDYHSAVEQGVILNIKEYKEMQEFSETAFQLIHSVQLPNKVHNFLISQVSYLKKLIQNKASLTKIISVTKLVKDNIIKTTGFKTSPSVWPDYKNGKKLFTLNCVQCHGVKGDGKGVLAKGLTSAPANFLDNSYMSKISPFQAYNTITLGVNGTAMIGFNTLTNKEVWDLAFYVKSLRFKKQSIDTILIKSVFNKVYSKITLKDVATLSDKQLLAKLGNHSENKMELKALRIFSPSKKIADNSLIKATNYLRSALKNYKDGKNKIARQDALSAYLEGIEPSEARLKSNAPAFSARLEQQMLKVRQSIEQKKTKLEVEDKVKNALTMIVKAELLMKDKKLNYWLAFLLSVSIMLREGLEAFLIIALMLALIRTSGIKKARIWVHGGWFSAVILGIAGWFLSDWIISFGGQNREIMEGLISLVAVMILAFVGLWLNNNSHAEKWKIFVENKIGKQLRKERMYGLAIFSFIVVFREAFESILFLQAVNIETTSVNKSSIGFGVITAFGLIALFTYLFLKYSKKIPIKQMFLYSSWGISFLAIILLGKGIHSIQESGWFSVTSFPISINIDWLGIYPTVETIVPQFILFVTILILYYLSNQRKKVQLT